MDVITYVDDLILFREEAKALAQTGDINDLSYDAETDALIYGVDKTPVHYNGNRSVTLIRVDSDEDLQHFNHMTRLGECVNGEYVFDSEQSEAIYDQVYDSSPYTINIDGELVTVTPPKMIGVFA